MAIFNSYFDITRGYTIRSICSICSRPWTARASACWRPPRLLWCRRCRRRCGDAGGWASTRNGCGSGRRPWWSWRRRSHGSHGKGEGGPKHCTYMEIQWNTTDIQWKHTDIYIYIYQYQYKLYKQLLFLGYMPTTMEIWEEISWGYFYHET